MAHLKIIMNGLVKRLSKINTKKELHIVNLIWYKEFLVSIITAIRRVDD